MAKSPWAEQIEEQRAAVATAVETTEATNDAETPVKEVVEKVSEVEPEKEKTAEEPKLAEPVEEKEKSPAQLRIEKKKREQLLATEVENERAGRQRAEARIAELERGAVKVEDRDPEPNAAEDPTAHLAWENRQIRQELKEVKQDTQVFKQKEATNNIRQSALAEVAAFENSIRGKVADYDAAKNYYANFEAYIIKRDNPNMNPAQLNEAVTFKMMKRLAHFQNEGYENPVEAMYEEAKTLGYKTHIAEKAVEEKKPNLERVGKNRERNAGMTGAQGGGGDDANPTPNFVATQMTVAEAAKHFKTMTPMQKKEWYNQQGR